MKKRRRKNITEVVSPEILEVAKQTNARYNKHLSHGHTVKYMRGNRNDYELVDAKIGTSVPLELSVLMSELADVINEKRQINE